MDQAEQLRNVIKRKNLNNIGNARVITITSGKGGVGKSNVAVNLAVCLRRRGQRVIILDADLGLANVEVMFGTVPEYDLGDVVYCGKSMGEVITRGPMDIGFISGGSGMVSLNNLSREQRNCLVDGLKDLNDLCDVLLIDTGAGVSNTVLDFVLASPEILLVTTPEPSSLTDAYSLLKALYKSEGFQADRTQIHVIANKVTSEAEGKAVYDKLESVVEQFLGGSLHYLGVIPADAMLDKAVRNQRIVCQSMPSSKSAKAIEELTSSLLTGEDVRHYRWGITQMFNSLSRRP